MMPKFRKSQNPHRNLVFQGELVSLDCMQVLELLQSAKLSSHDCRDQRCSNQGKRKLELLDYLCKQSAELLCLFQVRASDLQTKILPTLSKKVTGHRLNDCDLEEKPQIQQLNHRLKAFFLLTDLTAFQGGLHMQ